MKPYTILRIKVPHSGRGPRALENRSTSEVQLERIDERDLREILRDPSVAAAAPVMRTRLVMPTGKSMPMAGSEGATWGVQGVRASESPFDGTAVSVAILDTGIDTMHPAFRDMQLVEEDFTGEGSGDRQGHGTHCAGTFFGRHIDGMRIGVAPGIASAFIGKVLRHDGAGDSSALFRGLQWAIDKGVRVISMSLGFDFPGMTAELVADGWPVELATSAALEAYGANLRMFDALMEVVRARKMLDGGALVVAAAGNESRRNINPNFAIAASVPATAKGVISVGALEKGPDHRLHVAPFSNKNPELSAPGCDITSAQAGGGLVSLSGTSMATPHVAGVAALWWHALSAGKRLPNSTIVAAKLLAEARTDVFASDVAYSDRGEGLVTAPLVR